jgi:L-threonylcarbamoyladenylate synthase
MKIFSANDGIPFAVDALRSGGIVCYPTETFYALGIDPWNEDAREKLYAVKKRSEEKDLPLIACDLQMVSSICDTSDSRLAALAKRFWPGPLTIVLYSSQGTGSFAVRVSSHPIARRLAKSFGLPIVSTSANLSGEPPLQDPRSLANSVEQNVDVLLDDGLCRGKEPSTIVSLLIRPGMILREGAIPAEQVLSLL